MFFFYGYWWQLVIIDAPLRVKESEGPNGLFGSHQKSLCFQRVYSSFEKTTETRL